MTRLNEFRTRQLMPLIILWKILATLMSGRRLGDVLQEPA